MKKFIVGLPVNGIIYRLVEAENEKGAIKKALDDGNFKIEEMEEWEVLEKVIQGNIAIGQWLEATAEET